MPNCLSTLVGRPPCRACDVRSLRSLQSGAHEITQVQSTLDTKVGLLRTVDDIRQNRQQSSTEASAILHVVQDMYMYICSQHAVQRARSRTQDSGDPDEAQLPRRISTDAAGDQVN